MSVGYIFLGIVPLILFGCINDLTTCDDVSGAGGKFASSYIYESRYSMYPELVGYIFCDYETFEEPQLPRYTSFTLKTDSCPGSGARILNDVRKEIYHYCVVRQQNQILKQYKAAHLDEKGKPFMFQVDHLAEVTVRNGHLEVPGNALDGSDHLDASSVYVLVDIPHHIKYHVKDLTHDATHVMGFRSLSHILKDMSDSDPREDITPHVTSMAFCKDNNICTAMIDTGWIIIYSTPTRVAYPVCIDSGSICIICQEPLNSGSEIIEELCCSHAYHMSCIDRWRKIRKSCPYCNARIAPR